MEAPQISSSNGRKAIWHPYTQMQGASHPLIVRAKGAILYDEEGHRYLDGISSWWVNLHGHAHPYISTKIAAQAERLDQVTFADFTHAPAIDLAERLLSLLPGAFSKVFYSDNGSTAVEVALKIALQFWYNGDPKTPRKNIVCMKNSFHGETFGAMSASGRQVLHRPFWSHLFEVETIDPPLKGQEKRSLSQLHDILHKGRTACFIFEPLILGSGGMIIYPPEGLDHLIQACRQHGVLTIADEVMTGFGRTGTLFVCEQFQTTPDFICLSKALTGGFLPLGATVCTEAVYSAFLGDNLQKALLHGHSYTANPLACASALANLDLLLQDSCRQQRMQIAASHEAFCRRWRAHPRLKRCESLGTILALEYLTEETSYFQPIRNRLFRFFFEKGVYLRPLGNVLYVMPPYCIQEDELQLIYSLIAQTLEDGI
ncbi:MAG: adenosylmethionine--8-amino-7-oxononanoate transaminase [Parachlamydia sp.]|nr:adenosylmethionine--8-amino-7-oxononanoate transaminase [Parachlamydia sp.]